MLPPVTAELGWPLRQPLDFHVYLSTNRNGDVFSKPEDLPHFVWDNILFGSYDESRTVSYDVNFPEVRLTIQCLPALLILIHTVPVRHPLQ